ncbi:hypothetical protein Lgee_0020 [Legionella geestiana]|uniref:Uncharacterized protein n=1 Tax=Legionella geestiana TaxID=45065 RepID=A0A0W0UA62_9GAMM|nr:ankyrin repeat domain-containing protein [Legionella geestiana]KTD04836.1 hypothetical protein Lgee_0020 [Legionella geestiana]QBS11335.1 ankyrin repeat domain-containing protein [Legionella geestiana]STX54015.1 Uncharacterised protein [Legionella geestiana]
MLEKVEKSHDVIYPLHEAAKANDYFTVMRLLREGANPLFADSHGKTGSQLASDRLVVNALQEAENVARAQVYVLELPKEIPLCELRPHMYPSVNYGFQEEVWIRVKLSENLALRSDIHDVIDYPVPSFFLKKLLEVAREQNVNLDSRLMRRLLDVNVRSYDVENVEALLNHGATYSQETLDEIHSTFINPDTSLTPEALQASVSIFQLLLARTGNMEHDNLPQAVGTYRWTRFRPFKFQNPNQWEDLLRGYDDMPEWAVFAPLTNMFSRIPKTPRMPCLPLATELKAHVRLEDIPDSKRVSKGFLTGAFRQTTDRPLELMAVLMAMMVNNSPVMRHFLQGLTDQALHTHADYMHAAYSFFMLWKDFIILAKTKETYTAKHHQYCESLNQQGIQKGLPKRDALNMVFSTDEIRCMEEESVVFSRLTRNHTAILAKSALREAEVWFDCYLQAFVKTLQENGIEHAAHLTSQKKWINVEGIPSLALLCERNIQQHSNTQGFFSRSEPPRMQASSSSEVERPLRNDAGCSYES